MKKNISILLLFLSACVFAQQAYTGKVGINQPNPTENLDVNGIVRADLLYLRTPGEPLELPIRFMASDAVNLDVFDPALGKPSLVNYLKLTFTNVNNDGITAYNTKINALDYIAAVRSFSISNNTALTDLEVYTVHQYSSTTANGAKFQGSPDFVAYVDNSTPGDTSTPLTWWIRARYLDSKFSKGGGAINSADRFVITVQLLVYKKMITKYVDQTQTVNLGGTAGAGHSVPVPSGF